MKCPKCEGEIQALNGADKFCLDCDWDNMEKLPEPPPKPKVARDKKVLTLKYKDELGNYICHLNLSTAVYMINEIRDNEYVDGIRVGSLELLRNIGIERCEDLVYATIKIDIPTRCAIYVLIDIRNESRQPRNTYFWPEVVPLPMMIRPDTEGETTCRN